MTRRLFVAFLLLLAFVMSACGRDDPGSAQAPGSVQGDDPPAQALAQAKADAVVQSDGEDEAQKALKARMRHGKRNSEPLVGGCRDACGDAKGAFKNFTRAMLLETPPEDLPSPIRFIDTTTLVDNGADLGRQWARMYLDGQLAERKESVDTWFKGYQARTGGKTDPQLLEASLESGLQFRRLSSSLVEFTWTRPPVVGGSTGDIWVVKMNLRALQWLVSEIRDNP